MTNLDILGKNLKYLFYSDEARILQNDTDTQQPSTANGNASISIQSIH